jgi:anti-sigma regulatory factor (Ser/Thr protein kinase)
MDSKPPEQKRDALATLAAAAQRCDSGALALAGFDAALSGASRDEVEHAVREGASTPPLGLRVVSAEIEQLVADVASIATTQRVAVEAHIEPGLLSSLPAATLCLVVWNLLSNAIEASPAGAVVVLTVAHRSGDLRVSVEDRGAGLPAALRARVFDAQFSTKGEGRGLGLSLVQDEVRRFGGRVEVSSPSRGGARFVVTLPGAAVADVASPHNEADVSGVVRKRPLAGQRVALICDFVFLERALTAFGAEVTRSSFDEVAAAPAVHDVLVADTAEISAASAVHLKTVGRARRVIVLAAEGQPLVADGADVVLARSFDLSELAAAIERVLVLDAQPGTLAG